METIYQDYSEKGVAFYYIYKPLAHPEHNGYVSPFSLQERLMHVAEAKRRLGSGITWLADTMANDYHESMGRTPNSELVVDANGIVVARRSWSNPDALRADLERLVGPVDKPTQITDLDLPTQPALPTTVARGVVPRVDFPEGAMPMEIVPNIEDSKVPFYTKLRAEGTPSLYQTGSGTLYIGFHLDPLYEVHWNNEAPPLEFEITTPDGVSVTPAKTTGPTPEEIADADPREFLVEVSGAEPGGNMDLSVLYYACDNALTFCIPVRQDYQLTLARDVSHGWSQPMDENGNRIRAPMGMARGMGMGAPPGAPPPADATGG